MCAFDTVIGDTKFLQYSCLVTGNIEVVPLSPNTPHSSIDRIDNLLLLKASESRPILGYEETE